MADNELVININGDSSDFKKAINGLQSNLKSVAVASGAAFAALSAGIGVTVKDFAKFDNEITAVKTLLDESSFATKSLDEGFEDLRKGLVNVGAQFPVSIEGLNKALFDTVSAGVDASESIDFVATAAKLGVAGLTDVSVATDGLTTATNAFGLSAAEADLTAAKFFTAQKFGKTTIEELSGSLGVVAASAASAGVSFDEVLASVSAATLAGVKTNAAYTSLKAVFANVVKPTAEASAEAERLGIQFDSASLRSKGLAQFLTELTEAENFTAESAERLFGSVEALNVIQALTGSQSQKFADILSELGNETKLATTFNEAFETQNATLANQFILLKNQLQAISIELGAVFAPVVGVVVGFLKNFATSLRENETAVQTLAIAIGIGAAGSGLIFALSSIGLALPAIVTGLTTLKTALFGAAVGARALAGATGFGALVLVGTFVIKNLDEVINFMTGPLFAAFTFITEVVQQTVQKFVSAFSAIKLAVTGNLSGAVAEARIALTPLPVIFFDAAKKAGDAFDAGQAIGLAKQAQKNAETVANEQDTANKVIDIAQKSAGTRVTVADTRAQAARDIEDKKAKDLVDIESNMANDLLAIDSLLGDSQVAEYANTTNELIGLANQRAAGLTSASASSAGGFSGGAGIDEFVVGEGSALRELLDNPEKFTFGPGGFKKSVTNQAGIIPASFFGFNEGFSGLASTTTRKSEGFNATFGGREIVIPENFADGIRQGRFSLVGPGGNTSGRGKLDIQVGVSAGEFTRAFTVRQNSNRALKTDREVNR